MLLLVDLLKEYKYDMQVRNYSERTIKTCYNSTLKFLNYCKNEFNLDDYIMENNSYHYSKFKEALKIDLITMQDTVKYFQDNLPLDFFKGIIDKVPEVWENDKDELRALSEYLIYRMEHITDFAEMILSYKY